MDFCATTTRLQKARVTTLVVHVLELMAAAREMASWEDVISRSEGWIMGMRMEARHQIILVSFCAGCKGSVCGS